MQRGQRQIVSHRAPFLNPSTEYEIISRIALKPWRDAGLATAETALQMALLDSTTTGEVERHASRPCIATAGGVEDRPANSSLGAMRPLLLQQVK
jgi:hypothetical protein